MRKARIGLGVLGVVGLAVGFFDLRPTVGQPPGQPSWPAFTPIFLQMDSHALKAPKSAENSIAELAAYLAQAGKKDALKVRAIYRWMTDRIALRADEDDAKKPGDVTPESVLQARTATARGYAVLFKALCEQIKIEVKLIHGYAKTSNSKPDDPLKTNHVWTGIRMSGKWHLVDVTRSSGEIKGKKWEKVFQPYYYFTPPDRLIFSHFPEKAEDQLLPVPITADKFRQRLVVPDGFARYFYDMKKIQDTLDAPTFRGFAKVSWMIWDSRFPNHNNFPLKLVEAPLEKHLKKGQLYVFRYHAPFTMKTWITGLEGEVARNGEVYIAFVHPKTVGPLMLTTHLLGQKVTILEYEVEE